MVTAVGLGKILIGFVVFYGVSVFVGYLISNPFIYISELFVEKYS